MDRRQFIATGTAVLTTTIAGCGGTESSDRQQEDVGDAGDGQAEASTSTPTATATESETKVKLLDHEFYNDGSYDAGVKGTAENVADEELSYVEVKVFFLDSDGVQIGEGMDNTTDLAAGRKWKFDAGFLEENAENVDSYEIKTDVSSY